MPNNPELEGAVESLRNYAGDAQTPFSRNIRIVLTALADTQRRLTESEAKVLDYQIEVVNTQSFAGDCQQAAEQLAQQLAESEAKFNGACREMHDVEQSLGKALGFPWYKDDQKNFPAADENTGVCVGEHTPASIAADAADVIRKLKQQLADSQAKMPCGHPKSAWVEPWHPAIPDWFVNPLLFMDKNLGVVLLIEIKGVQWIHKIVNKQWMSVRQVDVNDPPFIEPLGFCTTCREVSEAVRGEMEKA